MLLIVSYCVAAHACYIGSKIAVSLYALQLGASQTTIGWLAAFYASAPLVMGVYSGRVADRHGARWPLISGACVVCAGMLIGVFELLVLNETQSKSALNATQSQWHTAMATLARLRATLRGADLVQPIGRGLTAAVLEGVATPAALDAVAATAGGVVFAGALDRSLVAYDDMTGKELWRTRLGDVPSNAPISYALNGRQYLAVVVGNGGAQAPGADAPCLAWCQQWCG